MAMGVGFGYYAYYTPGPGHLREPHLHAAGAEDLRGHVERRADRGAAVPVHGLPGRARQHPRPAVPLAADLDEERSRRARRRDAGHLRDVRDRDRHRRRGRDADGAAGVPGHAARRLRREALGRRGLRRRLPRHPDPAEHPADRLCRDGRRLGGQALCGRVPAGLPAHRPLHGLRDRAGHDQSGARAEAAEGADRHPVRRGALGAADLVLPARPPDRLGARRHPVRPGDAVGSGRRRRARRHRARRRLSARSTSPMLQESVYPDRARDRDGLLPVHRLVDLLVGVRAARRAGGGRAVLPRRSTCRRRCSCS